MGWRVRHRSRMISEQAAADEVPLVATEPTSSGPYMNASQAGLVAIRACRIVGKEGPCRLLARVQAKAPRVETPSLPKDDPTVGSGDTLRPPTTSPHSLTALLTEPADHPI